MKIKTTRRYHYAAIRKAKIIKTSIPSNGKDAYSCNSHPLLLELKLV
jgi:hypothetical protein